MSGYLPYGGFKWLQNVDDFDVNWVIENNPIGYILEVHLKYPEELRKLHNDFPLAPEKLAILFDMLSDYCKKCVDECGIKVGYVKKFIPNLGDKPNYVVYYRNLLLSLSLRIKLTKIHKIFKFKQSDWMKIYIDFNTKKRTNDANGFEKYFFILMINSFYGKFKLSWYPHLLYYLKESIYPSWNHLSHPKVCTWWKL